jgi:hypothetical protein
MRTILRRTRHTVLGMAVLGALGFGASAALAEPLRLPECTDPYASGPCATSSGCRSFCESKFGPGIAAYCNTSTYCCYCIEL